MVCVTEQGSLQILRLYFASQAGNYSEETCVDSLIIFDTQQISLIQNIAQNNDLAG